MSKKIIFNIIFILSTISLGFSGYNIFVWYQDNNKIQEQTDEISNNTTVNEVVDNNQTIVIESDEKEDENSPYWDYVKMNLIDVDFSELRISNNHTIGWIQVSGTNINYPFVQTKDNKFYLDHSFDKTYNKAGWVFMDYRNSVKKFDKNTILYAHGRVDKSMFGSLRTIFSSNWYKNKSNHIIKLSTEYENTLWQVFSVYRIKTTSDYLQNTFSNNAEFTEFAKVLKDRSGYSFDTSISENDKILTLSTCYNEDDKVVMHAKLIKISKK